MKKSARAFVLWEQLLSFFMQFAHMKCFTNDNEWCTMKTRVEKQFGIGGY